jgi:hypothetical protein
MLAYNGSMLNKQKDPASARTLTGSSIHTAEAAQTHTLSIALQAVELNRRFHDLPQLPIAS